MPMDRSPLITDAPQGHSPAARIERLTAQRDVLLEACRALRLCIDDRQYPDVYHQACEAIAAVESNQ